MALLSQDVTVNIEGKPSRGPHSPLSLSTPSKARKTPPWAFWSFFKRLHRERQCLLRSSWRFRRPLGNGFRRTNLLRSRSSIFGSLIMSNQVGVLIRTPSILIGPILEVGNLLTGHCPLTYGELSTVEIFRKGPHFQTSAGSSTL